MISNQYNHHYYAGHYLSVLILDDYRPNSAEKSTNYSITDDSLKNSRNFYENSEFWRN